MNEENIEKEEIKEEIQEEVKEEVKEELTQAEIIQLIKDKFTHYLHSPVVLARAVKSCPIPQINDYLTKYLEQEPKWENKWNLVYGIINNIDLPKCRFCGKQLPYSAIAQKNFYCSEECEQTDISLKETNIKPTGYETVQKTQSFFDKIKNIFKRK